MACLLLLPPAARAGTYSSPVFSGGQWFSSDWDPGLPHPYEGSGDTWGTGDSSMQVNSYGDLSAAFTWSSANNPADPAPPCILMQNSYAEWQLDFPSNPASCNDGLGDSEVDTYDGQTYRGLSTGTRYSVGVPNSSGVISQSLAGAQSQINPGVEYGIFGSIVMWTVTASPVTITPTGTTTVNNALTALTGQQLGGTLNVPSGCTVQSYAWSVSTNANPPAAADVFKTYNENATSNQLVLLSGSDLTGASFNFYDKKQETIIIQCNAVLTAPDGTTSLTVTAQSQPISVVKPTAQWSTNQGSLSSGFHFEQAGMGALEIWNSINITVPAPFSGGTGCLAQLITPTIQYRRNPLNGQPDLCYYKVPQTVNGVTTMVLPGQGLDTHFPYPTGIGTDGNGNPTLVQYPSGYTWDVSGAGFSGDGPSVDFTIPAADNGGNDWYTCYATEIFTTWLMYKPSTGVNPIWIPLQRIDWNWQGNVTKDSVTGQWGATNPNNGPGSASSSTVGLDTTDVPQWSAIYSGFDQVYP